jgi:Bacterial antitoxin of type II TA system, VapB
MRTTLELDDDLVAQARQLAKERGVTIGQLISDLALRSLIAEKPMKMRNGIPVFTPKPGAPRPDLALVNRLRDDE